MVKLVLRVLAHWPNLRKPAFRILFGLLSCRYRHLMPWTQTNYGYAEGPGPGHTIALQPHEETERYSHQLYYRTINGIDLRGKDIIEVSCGRGGGAALIHRLLHPRSYVGVDVARPAIKFCRRAHRAPGLRFVEGEAERLPVRDQSADAVLNVEAALCYPNRQRFFDEVHRVLRPGGYFLYADMHGPEETCIADHQLAAAGFELVEKADITAHVARALELDAERRESVILAYAPWILRGLLRGFAGTPGTYVPEALNNGSIRYYCLTLRKSREELRPLPATTAAAEMAV